jgi:hypothetical protein
MAEGVSSLSFSTAVRASRKDCTVVLFQCICCFLFMRLAMISLTALSTNAVEIEGVSFVSAYIPHTRARLPLSSFDVGRNASRIA